MSKELESGPPRRIRRYLLIRGAFLACAVAAIGVANDRFTSTFAQAVVVGLTVGLFALVLIRADRASAEDKASARSYVTVGMGVSLLVYLGVLTAARQFVDALGSALLASGAVMTVWALISWWAGRPRVGAP